MERQSALKILGLGPDATRAQAKKAYRQLAKTCHPDRFSGRPGAAAAEIRMKHLNAAFSFLAGVLPDPDRPGEAGTEPGGSSAAVRNARPRGEGFFSAFGKGLRAMAGQKRKRAPAGGKARAAAGRRPAGRPGPRAARKKASPGSPPSFDRILRENCTGEGQIPKTSRPRPAAWAGDPYSRYVRFKQQLRNQRRRSRRGMVSRVEKITPVRPVSRVGDN